MRMLNRYQRTITGLAGKTIIPETSPAFSSGPVEVNVIFTEPEATAAALKFADSLVRELGGRIRLRAATVAPIQFALDEPPVSLNFVREHLANLASGLERCAFEPTADLYVCRDRVQALLQALEPQSIVVIGGTRRWWPTTETRLARALRSKGHVVMFVDCRATSAPKESILAR